MLLKGVSEPPLNDENKKVNGVNSKRLKFGQTLKNKGTYV